MADAASDLHKLQNDILRLEAALNDARLKAEKLNHYIELRTLYENGGSLAASDRGASTGKAKEITEAAIRVLRRENRPVKTPRLLNELGRDGMRIPSSNQRGYLSSILSRADGVVADRVVGWRLSEWAGIQYDSVDDDESGPQSESESLAAGDFDFEDPAA